jgi:hypothetical protein
MSNELPKEVIDRIKQDAEEYADKEMRYSDGRKYSWSPIHYVAKGFVAGALRSLSIEAENKELKEERDRYKEALADLEQLLENYVASGSHAFIFDKVKQIVAKALPLG